MNTDEKLVFFGDAIKAVVGKENTIGGYLVRFSSAEDPDLTNEFFTKNTQFGPNLTPPLLYHHGFDPKMKASIIGSGSWTMDEVGIWYEAQLAMADQYQATIMKLAEQDKLRFSSGAVTVEREQQGKSTWLKTWIIGEASLTPTPAEPRNVAMPVKSIFTESNDLEQTESTVGKEEEEKQEAKAVIVPTPEIETQTQTKKMEPEKTPTVDVAQIAKDAIKAYQVAQDEAAAEALKAKAIAPQKEQYNVAPAVVADSSHWKFDNYPIEELSFTAEFLNQAEGTRRDAKPASDSLLKTLAMRMDSKGENGKVIDPARHAFKSWQAKSGVKANEIAQSTLASYGDEWVGVAYSSNLWESVRSATSVVGRIPSFEFPAGAESMVIPIESTDPVWFLVAQASALSSNPGGIPTNTVTSSQVGTANKTATLSKLGARSLYTGELSEDAVLPFAGQLQKQLVTSGAEYLESAVIDGDTATGATTNINDIAGTPAATDWFLAFNGFRKSCLVTTTANSRDAGALTASDFLETAKLLGTAGQLAEPGKTSFILDASTYWKAIELTEVKTRDVFSSPTIENGRLTGIYGFDVSQSFHMHKAQPSRLANANGKVDLDTAGNNTTGSLLAVRWDQWMFGYRRRMTLETSRIAAADSTEIVAIMRASLTQRGTEGSAISYNITV